MAEIQTEEPTPQEVFLIRLARKDRVIAQEREVVKQLQDAVEVQRRQIEEQRAAALQYGAARTLEFKELRDEIERLRDELVKLGLNCGDATMYEIPCRRLHGHGGYHEVLDPHGQLLQWKWSGG